MKKFHLAVTTLEEHEPNREFVGRNFNNGEIIQLVLRNRNSGGWLPFRQVQMVMMHELAHNVQMNHGKAFWVERNRFAGELRVLWGRGYTGDGLWGGGRTLEDAGIVEGNAVKMSSGGGDVVENLCGGTYRSRRRKRRRHARAQGPDLTWKEKRDRRIEKKFGRNGVALGEDEDKRLRLEIGKRGPIGGKPRVANSKRGRELRAAAALKRFGDQKLEEELEKLKAKEEDEGGTDSQDEYEEDDTADGEVARDRNGQKLLDSMGFGLVKVRDEEDTDNSNIKREQEELEDLSNNLRQVPQHHNNDSLASPHPSNSKSNSTPRSPVHHAKILSMSMSTSSSKPTITTTIKPDPDPDQNMLPTTTALKDVSPPPPPPNNANTTTTTTTIPPSPFKPCPLCTLHNPPNSLTCAACLCVLRPQKVAGTWRCTRPSCAENKMVNAADVAVCGACGGRRTQEGRGK